MNRRLVTSFFHRSFGGCLPLADSSQPTPNFDPFSDLPKDTLLHLDSSFVDSPDEMMRSLLEGYLPTFKRHPLGCEAESLLILKPSQQMCYYDNKLFGGYLALLMDRILADCCKQCKPAVTAYLNTSFVQSVPPTVPILLRAWPDKVEGRKLYLKGSIRIPGKASQGWVEAIKADALFIRPRGWEEEESG